MWPGNDYPNSGAIKKVVVLMREAVTAATPAHEAIVIQVRLIA